MRAGTNYGLSGVSLSRTNCPASAIIGSGRVIPLKRGGLQGSALDGEERLAGVATTNENCGSDRQHTY
jgi:hypothetical protein